MITASGSLELCYDELQRPYITPLFCMVNPSNILCPNKPQSSIIQSKIVKSVSQSTMIAQPINLKVRINPGDFNLNIAASTADSIQDLKHYILESSQQVHTLLFHTASCFARSYSEACFNPDITATSDSYCYNFVRFFYQYDRHLVISLI